MSEEQFYKDGISKMLSTIHNVNWLLKIYSFIKERKILLQNYRIAQSTI